MRYSIWPEIWRFIALLEWYGMMINSLWRKYEVVREDIFKLVNQLLYIRMISINFTNNINLNKSIALNHIA
jgi:hypothetical protein